MNRTNAKSSRISYVLFLVIAATSAVPLSQYGIPWIQYHQNNLVIYDCRLHSQSLPVGAKYPGQIEEIFVETGQTVAVGDVIAHMDSQQLNAEVEKAKASIELAKANHKAEQVAIEKSLATMIAQQECLVAKANVADSRVVAIQVESKWIEKELNRARKLAGKGSVSKSSLEKIYREFENFENKARIAGEEDLIADLDLEALKIKIEEIQARTAVLDVMQQQIAIAKSELKLVNEMKTAATIKAQNSGIVTDIFRGAGSSVKIGEPIIQIQEQNVWCEAWIDEQHFAKVEMNASAGVVLKAFPDSEIRGRVSSFLPTPDSLVRRPNLTNNPILQPSSKICVKIQLDPTTNLSLMPGLSGTAIIKIEGELKPIENYQVTQRTGFQTNW